MTNGGSGVARLTCGPLPWSDRYFVLIVGDPIGGHIVEWLACRCLVDGIFYFCIAFEVDAQLKFIDREPPLTPSKCREIGRSDLRGVAENLCTLYGYFQLSTEYIVSPHLRGTDCEYSTEIDRDTRTADD